MLLRDFAFKHLSYSPDPAPSNYHIFLQLKKGNKTSFNEEEAWFQSKMKDLEALQVRCKINIFSKTSFNEKEGFQSKMKDLEALQIRCNKYI